MGGVAKLAGWLLTNAVALAAACQLVPGVGFDGASHGSAELSDKVGPLLLVALIMGLVNAVVRPVVKVLSLPLVVLTLGLFLLVVNALMLFVTEGLAGLADLGFHVDGFWAAVGGAIVVTVVTWLVQLTVGERDD
jgi:putative membrane protein